MATGDIDFGGSTLIVKEIKTGAAAPGTSSTGASNTVAAGSALTINPAAHAGKVILLNTASGSTVTLPPSTGSGVTYRFYVSNSVTSNSHVIKVANATDTMRGFLLVGAADSATASGEATSANDDTISMNGTTTGGIVGSYLELTDLIATVWQVKGWLVGSGTKTNGQFSASV